MTLQKKYRRRPAFDQPEFNKQSGLQGITGAVLFFLRSYWPLLVVFTVPWLLYYRALFTGFHSDDYLYHVLFTYSIQDFIEKMALIHSGEIEFPFFRPVVIASFRFDYMVWGANAFGFHLTNVLIHSVNTALIYLLAIRTGLGKFGSITTALVFTVWPIHPEAVVWISGRFDLLSAAFILLSLLLWYEARIRDRDYFFLIALASFVLAILAKEVAAVSLLLFPMLDWIINNETKRERGEGIGFHWKWYLVFFAIVVSYIGFRYWFYHGDIGGYYNEEARAKYLLTDLESLWSTLVLRDIWMLITPVSRILWEEINTGFRYFMMILGITGLIWFLAGYTRSFFFYRRHHDSATIVFTVGAMWIIVMLLPVAPINGVTEILDFSRFLYIPAIGLAIMAGSAMKVAIRSGNAVKIVSGILMLSILLTATFTTSRHITYWEEAGEIAGIIHETMEENTSELRPGSTVFVVNFPWLWKGAHCAPLDYEGYIEFRYGIKNVYTHIMRMEPDEIPGWWARLREKHNTPGIGFVWDSESMTCKVLPPIKYTPTGAATVLPRTDNNSAPPSAETSEVEITPERLPE